MTATATVGTYVTGTTTLTPAAEATNSGLGDYLEILNMQAPAGAATTAGPARISGVIFAATGTAHASICSYVTPFKVGVKFDQDDAIFLASTAPNTDHHETHDFSGSGGAYGFQGFNLNYFQKTC